MALWGATFIFQNTSPGFLRRDTDAFSNHAPFPNDWLTSAGLDAVGWGYPQGYDSNTLLPNYDTMRFLGWCPLQKVDYDRYGDAKLVPSAACLLDMQTTALSAVRTLNLDPTDRQKFPWDFATWVWDTDKNDWNDMRVVARDLRNRADDLDYSIQSTPGNWVATAAPVPKKSIWQNDAATKPPQAPQAPALDITTNSTSYATSTGDYTGMSFVLIVASIGLAAYLFAPKNA